jgi:hypothetical protein
MLVTSLPSSGLSQPGQGISGASSGRNGYAFPNAWVRLDRIGTVFTAYTWNDGPNWVRIGQATIPMTRGVTAGHGRAVRLLPSRQRAERHGL